MRRKKKNSTAGPKLDGRPETHRQWLNSFEEYEGIPAFLQQLAQEGVDLKEIRALLYAAPLLGGIKSRAELDKLDKNLNAVQRHLDAAANLLKPFPLSPQERKWTLGPLAWVRTQVEEHRQRLAELRSAFTTVQCTDLVIAILARDLEHAGRRRVNEDIATLLTAASVPGGTRDAVTNGWAWDASTVHKRRDRLKRKPFAALGPYRHLFGKVNMTKLAQKYPALFIQGKRRGKPESDIVGQKIAPESDFLSQLASPEVQTACSEGLSEALDVPVVGTKKLLKQS